jgi:hypothetical protein
MADTGDYPHAASIIFRRERKKMRRRLAANSLAPDDLALWSLNLTAIDVAVVRWYLGFPRESIKSSSRPSTSKQDI